MSFVFAVVKVGLRLVQFVAAAEKFWANFKSSAWCWPECHHMGCFAQLDALHSGRISNAAVDLLKLNQVKSLLFFDFQKRQNGNAKVCGFVGSQRPSKLGPMVHSAGLYELRGISAEGLVKEHDCFGFTHCDGDGAAESAPFLSRVNTDAAFAVNDPCGVCQIRRGDLFKGFYQSVRALFAKRFLACKPRLVSFSACRMMKGHRISLTDRWFGLSGASTPARPFFIVGEDYGL
jgi:hypothetical protein